MQDSARAETLTPIISIRGVSFKRFLFANENKTGIWKRVERNSLADKRAKPWKMNDILNLFGGETADVLFFAQGTMLVIPLCDVSLFFFKLSILSRTTQVGGL